ncbi:phosphotransferase [Streptomyces sp. NPDC060194]|uniref:phosphotransferase n=1 Tax=Streptomyces sp. NPDC060194 TaxID=3347069 RepID=UPI0036540BF3
MASRPTTVTAVRPEPAARPGPDGRPGPPARPRPVASDVYEAFTRHAVAHGDLVHGFHNRNYRVPLTPEMAAVLGRPVGETVMVRCPGRDVLPVVLRTWNDEAGILSGVGQALPHVPQCLFAAGSTAVHSYVEGVPLSHLRTNGTPVRSGLIGVLAGLFGDMTRVPREALPPLPADWPRDGDSRAFLRRLIGLTEEQVRVRNRHEFGGLFSALGVPEDALREYGKRLPVMVRRPFGLLHTDLHRDNVIFSFENAPPLVCVDWELASWGDPLHDLATHLVRMRYPEAQWDEVKSAWSAAMRRVRPAAVVGLETDLRHYVDFERAQSVYPDVMRAARSLLEPGAGPAVLRSAVAAVSQALELARGPLRLSALPGEDEVEKILGRWWSSRARVEDWPSAVATGPVWDRDGRLPALDGFSDDVLAAVLRAEGAAPAERVLKGSGHINTVVELGRGERAVMVRRKLSGAVRRERCYLEEFAVLGRLEELRGRPGPCVRAPRVLAVGFSRTLSGARDPFAVHTYEGPLDRPPAHPVDGLSLLEADDLVDQLHALTRVPTDDLAPPYDTHDDFCAWLVRELVGLVASLPRESIQLARGLGLPDANRLREILWRWSPAPRSRALLHGDLNPWNLLRGPESGQLTLIDWEMAIVGDPLYDLVRHLHLTPSTPAVRERMFRRWSRLLDEGFTKGWQDDVRIYRWIEQVRSAYVDLDRLVTGTLDAPNVRRAVDAYAQTLSTAAASLGLGARVGRIANPYLAMALPGSEARRRV